MTWAAFLALFSSAWKPVLLPLLTWVVGWLMPSPFQKLANKQADIAQAEKTASDPTTGNNVNGLDHLP